MLISGPNRSDLMFTYWYVFLILHEFCLTLFSFFFFPLSPKSVSPEDSEKRRTNYQAYRSYLNREGPKALGSKEIPKVWMPRGQAVLSGPLAPGSMHVFTIITEAQTWSLKINRGVPGCLSLRSVWLFVSGLWG